MNINAYSLFQTKEKTKTLINAVAAGNKCESYAIKVTVTKGETPAESSAESSGESESEKPSESEEPSGSDESASSGESLSGSGEDKPDPTNKGCLSAVNTVSVSAVVLLIAGAFVLAKKKKEN